MPTLDVQASTQIAAPIQRVRETLVDFTTWPHWSPWLYLEPDADVSYIGNKGEPGHGYQWSGKKVGAGSMKLTSAEPTRITCDLQFLKPFKSTASVWFELAESTPGTTQLSWHMNSRLPFFMFWMKESMSGMIRADYTRGLALLKSDIEDGSPLSQTRLVGTESIEASAYIGHEVVCSFDQLPSSMNDVFSTLADKQKAGLFTSSGNALCIYNKMNFKNNEVTYTAAYPVTEPVSVEPPLVSHIRPACSALKALHTGPYHHLPNAWAMLMSEARSRKLKVSKSIPPFEYYLNDADSTLKRELTTELYLPLK